MRRFFPVLITWLALGCAAATAQEGRSEAAVDLAARPAAGLTFVVDSVVNIEGKNAQTLGEEEEWRVRTYRRLGTKFTQKIDEVKDGRITRITREYGKCTEAFRSVQGKKETTRDQDYLLSHLVVTWAPGGMLFQAPGDGKPGRGAATVFGPFVRAPRVPRPFFPPPDHLVSPGDSWELDPEVLVDFYRTEFRVGQRRRRGPRRTPPQVDHSFRLVRVEEQDGRRTAVVRFEATVRTGDAAGRDRPRGKAMHLTIAATYRFCLLHHIVTGVDYRSEFEETTSTGRDDERRITVSTAAIRGKATARVVGADGTPGSEPPREASRPPK